MQKNCTQCGKGFTPSQKELETLDLCSPIIAGKKETLPPPADCPDCRRQRRLMFRNFFNLYHRTCDRTGKKIISMYDEHAVFPVYEMHEWWSDAWDPLAYGLPVDLMKPVFDTLAVLHRTVPRMSIVNTNCENCDYANMSFGSKNCYLVFGNVRNEDCAYGHIVWQSKDCYDCLYTYRSEFCYECIDCVQCHSLAFSRDCDNCVSSMLLVHCIGCQDCFGCVGLKNKRFHIFNEPQTEEEYRRKMTALNTGDIRTIHTAKERVRELIGKEIVKSYHGFNCENVLGDYLYNCKNIEEGYDLKNCEDCVYCATLESFRNCLDCNFSPSQSELCYQCFAVDGYNLVCCHNTLNQSARMLYCDNCYACRDCFGCMGLRNKQYCIFNTQYTKEEYETWMPKIIEHMRATGEFGQFFPHHLSPFGYNETIAHEYFHLTEAQARTKGWRWKEEGEDKTQQYLGPVVEVPDDSAEADESITRSILRCEATGKLYKIIPQELVFYRTMKLPLPRRCFEQRQRERFALRNPRHLWQRQCTKCGKGMETTYAPERPEIVYCESCYLSEVY